MPAELGLDHTEVAGVVLEAEIFEGFHHLAPSEPSEVSALAGGGTRGPCPCEGGEIRTLHYLIVYVLSFVTSLDQNVRCTNLLNHSPIIERSYKFRTVSSEMEEKTPDLVVGIFGGCTMAIMFSLISGRLGPLWVLSV